MENLELIIAGLDISSVLINGVLVAIIVGVLAIVRTLGLDNLYARHEKQLKLITEVAPDVFMRIAFPAVDDLEFQQALDYYEGVAAERASSGLSWIDPRMLYAIDRVEESLPEGYKVDLNIIIDKLETIYRKMKADGVFDGRSN
jgi:hypothetical protein